MSEPLRRPVGPDDIPAFWRGIKSVLDLKGIEPGEDFHFEAWRLDEPRRQLEAIDHQLGPFQRDSDTSRAAAIQNYPSKGSQRLAVMQEIARSGHRGATRDEIEASLGLTGNAVRPRVRELLEGDFVRVIDSVTRTTRNGGLAHPLVLTDKARLGMTG